MTIIDQLKSALVEDNYERIANLLPELFRQADEGKIVELPCKSAQPLYKISKHEPCTDETGCLHSGKDDCTECRLEYGAPYVEEYHSSQSRRIKDETQKFYEALGKTVFLTRESAEKALKESEKS